MSGSDEIEPQHEKKDEATKSAYIQKKWIKKSVWDLMRSFISRASKNGLERLTIHRAMIKINFIKELFVRPLLPMVRE